MLTEITAAIIYEAEQRGHISLGWKPCGGRWCLLRNKADRYWRFIIYDGTLRIIRLSTQLEPIDSMNLDLARFDIEIWSYVEDPEWPRPSTNSVYSIAKNPRY